MGLRYVGVLLGGDCNCPQKMWYVRKETKLMCLCVCVCVSVCVCV